MKTGEWIRTWWRFRAVVPQWFLVRDGDTVPRFMGIAWIDVARRAAIVLPIPLNLIARAVFNTWWWAKGREMWLPPYQKRLLDEYERGRGDGLREALRRWTGSV